MTPNKRPAGNGARTSPFHTGRLGRAVPEAERWVKLACYIWIYKREL
jgi:hypothetical protein